MDAGPSHDTGWRCVGLSEAAGRQELRSGASEKEGMTQVRAPVPDEHEQRMAVFERGGDSQATMTSSNEASIWWIRRVPETSTAAQTALEDVDEQWQPLSDRSGQSVGRTRALPQRTERWG